MMRYLMFFGLFLLWVQNCQAAGLKNSVREEAGLLKISLNNGAVIDIGKTGNGITGITQIYVKNIPLIPKGAAPIKPSFNTLKDKTLKEIVYKSIDYLGHTERSGRVTVALGLVREDGGKDAMNWIFAPRNIFINGNDYVGLQYNFEVVSSDKIFQFEDAGGWGIGGSAVGHHFVSQNALQFTDYVPTVESHIDKPDWPDWLSNHWGGRLSFHV